MEKRTVVVTGGFGALGRVVADAFAELDDCVVRLDFALASQFVREGVIDIGGVDLGDATAVDGAVRAIADKTGGIDVLVNVAGEFIWEAFDGGAIETWERMFNANVRTGATITRAALPLLKRSTAGRIINIGAGAALRADGGMGAYAASKSGVHRLTEALASELASSSVTVNAVLPSIIDTPANRADMPDADPCQWVSPRAVADVIVFLASPGARSISGALVPVSHPSSS